MGEKSPRQTLAFAAVSGLVSLVPIGRAPRGMKVALVAASGIAGGAAAFIALNRPDVFAASRVPVPAPQSAVIGAGVGGVAAGATALGIVMDRAFEQALVRRGVPHPRLALAAAGAVMSYVLDTLDRRFDTPS